MTDQHGPGHDVTDTDDPGRQAPTGVRPPARPRWVIWLIVGIAVAVLVFLGVHLIMGGGPMNHAPGMHHALPAWGVPGGLDGNAA